MNLPPNEIEMKVSLADEVNNTEEDIVNDVVDKVISDEQPTLPKQLFEAQPPAKKVKRKKKQMSEKQLAHLTRIRKLALEKRRQNRIAKTQEQPTIKASVATSPSMSYDKFEEYMTLYKKRKKEAKVLSSQTKQDKEDELNSSLFFKTYTNPCELYGNLF